MKKRVISVCAVFFMTAWILVSVNRTGLFVSVPQMSVPEGGTDADRFVALLATQIDLYIDTLHARGTLLGYDGTHLTAVTVRHLFDHAAERETEDVSACRVVFGNGCEAAAVLTASTETADLAFVEIDTSALSPEQLQGIATADPEGMRTVSLQKGDSVLVATSASDFRVGSVAWPGLYIPSAGGEMLCCYLDVEPGLSGSGVFDVNGVLCGVLSMGSDADEMLAVPAQQVYNMYQTGVRK